MMTLDQVLAEAPRDKHGSVKYPLECGCKSAHDMCNDHIQERLDDQRRLMGIADLRFDAADFMDPAKLPRTLDTIKLQLSSYPSKSCLIKVIPS